MIFTFFFKLFIFQINNFQPKNPFCLFCMNFGIEHAKKGGVYLQKNESEISTFADMLSAQSLTLPLPKELMPCPVHIKIYGYRYRRLGLLGSIYTPILFLHFYFFSRILKVPCKKRHRRCMH